MVNCSPVEITLSLLLCVCFFIVKIYIFGERWEIYVLHVALVYGRRESAVKESGHGYET